MLVKRLLRNRVTYAIEDAWLAVLRPLPAEAVNDTELKILGMRRSGNHAVIMWMMRAVQAGMPNIEHVFLNNCKISENAYRLQSDFRPPEYSDEEYRRIRARRNRAYRPTGFLIRSYEDYDLSQFRTSENLAYYGGSERRVRAVIIRDPLNLFASRLKVGYIDAKSKLSLVGLYLDHASALLRGSEELPILYNQWLMFGAYRENLLTELNIPGSDLPSDKAESFGPGSSFTGRGSELDKSQLLRRWEAYRDDPWFKREILGNSELMEITRTHFSEVLG
jgi:hypothetical protein